MKKHTKLTMILSLAVLVLFSFSACKKEDKKVEEPPVFYIATSKTGEEIKYQEGRYVDYEANEDIIGIVGAFDLEERVFSYLADGKHHLAKLYDEELFDEESDFEAKYKVEDGRVLVEPETFLTYFGFTITEEKAEKNSAEETATEETKKDDTAKADATSKENQSSEEDESTEKLENNASDDSQDHHDKLLMAWDNYGNNAAIEFPDALDVIIPKNMALSNAKGDCDILLKEDYIKNAKDQYKRIWFLATNSFDPNMTKDFLNSYSARKEYIDTIVDFCVSENVEGVSLDFENMHLDDSDVFVQFVAELHYELYKRQKFLAVCVTVPGGSDMWSKVYDRERIAENSDYLMLMAYDQHWASSQISGPVASLNWVQKNIEKLTKTIDKDKIILGVPFYTRLWYESYSNEVANKITVHSRDLYMYGVKNLLKELTEDYQRVWDNDASQYFFVYYEPSLKETIKFWYDDQDAVARKANLINQYNLPAASFWALGFESPDTWDKLEQVKNGEYVVE